MSQARQRSLPTWPPAWTAVLLALLALGLAAAGCDRSAPTATACLVVEAPVPADPRAGMVWIPGGLVTMGADAALPEERPERQVAVDGFWIAVHEVTNREFAAFVAATGYVTLAEQVDPSGDQSRGGGGVFAPGVTVRDWSGTSPWWRLDRQANWRQPGGAGTSITERPNDPVVQLAYADALAYARWRGHELPSEAEWEMAARGGLEGARYVWGDDVRPGGKIAANHHQGLFPFEDNAADGYAGRAPVGCFPANGFGLYDMAGNVWEWTTTAWGAQGAAQGLRVIKGGSFLCSDAFCHRYRPAARQPGDETFSTEHLGLRTVWRGPPPAEVARSVARSVR